VADGEEAKEYIMGNEDVLKKLKTYMASSHSCQLYIQLLLKEIYHWMKKYCFNASNCIPFYGQWEFYNFYGDIN
jgi:hypothetical protein